MVILAHLASYSFSPSAGCFLTVTSRCTCSGVTYLQVAIPLPGSLRQFASATGCSLLRVGSPQAEVPQDVSTPAWVAHRYSPFRGIYTCSTMAYLQPTVNSGVSQILCAASTGGSPFEGVASETWTAQQYLLPLVIFCSLLSYLSVPHSFSSCLSSHMSSPISPLASPAPHSCHSFLKIYEQQHHTCSSDRLRF